MLTFPTAQFDGVFMIKLIFRMNVHEKRKFRMKKHGFSNCCCSGCCHHRCINAMRLYVRHFNPMIKYMYGILLNETGTQVLLALHFPCWYDQLENTVFFPLTLLLFRPTLTAAIIFPCQKIQNKKRMRVKDEEKRGINCHIVLLQVGVPNCHLWL